MAGLLSRAISGSMVLSQVGSVLMSKARVSTKAMWISMLWTATGSHVGVNGRSTGRREGWQRPRLTNSTAVQALT